MGARLSVRNETTGHRYTVFVEAAPLLIGRASTSDIRLPFPVVSSRHLRLNRDDEGHWTIEELGSTNGTLLNGKPLEPGPATALTSGDELEIGSVSVSFSDDAQQDSGDFTLAQTGTLARKLVADALSFESAEDAAFIESVAGASKGLRKTITDDIDVLVIGSSQDAWLTLPDVAKEAARITRSGDGFAVQIVGEDEDPRPLASRDRIELAEHALVFFDPLESVLAESHQGSSATKAADPIESAAAENQSGASSPSDERDSESDTEGKEKGRTLGTAEWLLIGFASLIVVAGMLIMLTLFDLI